MWDRIKQRQMALLMGISVVFTLVFVSIYLGLSRSEAIAPMAQKSPVKSLTTGSSRLNPQEVWVHEVSTQMDLYQKQLETLSKSVELLIAQSLQAKWTIEQPQTPATDLKNSLKDQEAPQSMVEGHKGLGLLAPSEAHPEAQAHNGLSNPLNLNQAVQKITLNLHQKRLSQSLKTTDNTIPAGSFAQAILLGGVDASTSIQAASDPRPILLRLTHPGTLPRGFQSDLRGCHVLGAAFGELSSERVFMRLEKMSCTERKTGEVIEMPIQGYVAGEDGRAGLRGVVVDRAGAAMRNAMMGGFFSSIGKFLGQDRSPLLFSPQGFAHQNAMTGTALLKQSAGNGVGGALDQYAEFYIKRAEQMQPVIQVAAGRTVDIVFSQGFDFSDSALRKVLSKGNDQSRFQQLQSLEKTQSFHQFLPNHQEEQGS